MVEQRRTKKKKIEGMKVIGKVEWMKERGR